MIGHRCLWCFEVRLKRPARTEPTTPSRSAELSSSRVARFTRNAVRSPSFCAGPPIGHCAAQSRPGVAFNVRRRRGRATRRHADPREPTEAGITRRPSAWCAIEGTHRPAEYARLSMSLCRGNAPRRLAMQSVVIACMMGTRFEDAPAFFPRRGCDSSVSYVLLRVPRAPMKCGFPGRGRARPKIHATDCAECGTRPLD